MPGKELKSVASPSVHFFKPEVYSPERLLGKETVRLKLSYGTYNRCDFHYSSEHLTSMNDLPLFCEQSGRSGRPLCWSGKTFKVVVR